VIGRRALIRLCVATVCAVCALLGIAGASSAVRVPGPGSLQTGMVDEQRFQLSGPATRSLWLTRASQLGSRWVRIPALWFAVAPASPGGGFQPGNAADPRYRWSTLDEWVR